MVKAGVAKSVLYEQEKERHEGKVCRHECWSCEMKSVSHGVWRHGCLHRIVLLVILVDSEAALTIGSLATQSLEGLTTQPHQTPPKF